MDNLDAETLPKPKTSTEWKNQGNREFLDQDYEKAIQSYTEGLNLMEDDDGTVGTETDVQITCDLLGNRAAGYLKLGCFQTALEDVEKLLGLDPTNKKGLYRKAKALLALQRFQEALEFLELSPDPLDLDQEDQSLFMKLLTLTQNLLNQQMTGDYDLAELYKAGEIRHDDCADFVGPVNVQKVNGSRSGLGLVATQNIKPGQLISASKAFQIIFPEQEPNPCPGIAVFVNTGTNTQVHVLKTDTDFHQKIVQKIGQKLTLEPNLCRTLYQLYAGPHFPIFDTEEDQVVVDMNRIDAICRYNEFKGNMPNFEENFGRIGDGNGPDKSIGVWTLPSLINHRCWGGNATWMTFGDMLFVRAVKEISIGEEILMSYVNPTQLYEEREKILKKHGITCECQLCQIDRDKTPEGRKRMELLKQIETHQKLWCDQTGLESLVKKFWDLEEMKRNGDVFLKLNPSMIYPMIELGKSYLTRSVESMRKKKPRLQFKKSADWFTKCFELSTHSPLQKLSVRSCFHLIMVHLMDRNVPAAKKWTETLKTEIITLCGTLDKDMAVLMGKATLDFMEEYDIYL